MLHIHFGNRIERLADALAAQIAEAPPRDPFAPETVIVGHAGMDEWLKRALAERLGIAANLEFRQPAGFVWRMLRARDPALPTGSPLDRGPLVWRLYAALGAIEAKQAHEVAHYLAAGDELARFELAEALAAVFEQYQIYRPEWIRDWESGKAAAGDAQWQAALWRRVADAATPNPARLYEDFAAHADALAPDALPARISLFGLSALAPVYLDLLAAVARRREVHVYVPDPSQAYWGDIESEARLARWRLTRPERAEYAASGHPLLSALGTQNRDFMELLHGVAGDSVTYEHFEPPAGENLLARLQNDMLALVEQPEKRAPAGDDDSILVHVCHSRRREVEVLHDALLAAFESDPALGPEDILVMAPNTDDYAEHIAAVFGAAPPAWHIPWSLADRSVRDEHPVAEAMFALLDLPASRLKASEVMGLLDLPAVARAQALDADALADVHRWVEKAGIRWGFDGAHREQLGLPAESAFAWRFGLDRLLAGYALAPDEDSPWNDIAPWGEFEGKSARVLGPLCAFVAQLERWREALAAPRALADWAAIMRELLALFSPESPDESNAVAMLRQAVTDLESQAVLARFDDAVPRTVARAALAARLAVPRHPRPFLSGRVTFCALAPMRSIPAKLVWLLGMSEEDFPRRGRAPSFDLIAAHPRRGDRARRSEDRALFLEALCSARSAFHASYIGRSERDNADLPASVAINALLDVTERMGAARASVVIEHPLQPFSASYRAEPRRRASYAREWLCAPSPEAAPAAFATVLPAGEPEGDIALDDLIAGLSNPARRFLKALGVARRLPDAGTEDVELFTLEGLDKWRVSDELLKRRLAAGADFDAESCFTEFAARAWLPVGEGGRCLFSDCDADAKAVAEAVFECVGGETPQARDVDLSLGAWRLHGRIADVYPTAGLVCARAGGLRAKDRLGLWIRHLALCATGYAAINSRFIANDKGKIERLQLAGVDDAANKLQALCERYAESARKPLPLLPDLSLVFQETEQSRKSAAAANAAVRSQWQRWESGQGYSRIHDAEDYAWVFRGSDDLFGKEFAATARDVFGPIATAEVKG